MDDTREGLVDAARRHRCAREERSLVDLARQLAFRRAARPARRRHHLRSVLATVLLSALWTTVVLQLAAHHSSGGMSWPVLAAVAHGGVVAASFAVWTYSRSERGWVAHAEQVRELVAAPGAPDGDVLIDRAGTRELAEALAASASTWSSGPALPGTGRGRRHRPPDGPGTARSGHQVGAPRGRHASWLRRPPGPRPSVQQPRPHL